jgi:hypothetical protein
MVNEKFEIADYPKNGRIAKYRNELLILEKAQDKEGILAFSNKLFDDCTEYLKATYNFHFPKVFLCFLSHKEYSEFSDKLDAMLGTIPRHRAMTVFSLNSSPKIYIDFQSHIEGYRPAEFIVSLCMDYMEELIHTSDPTESKTQIKDTKNETQIQGVLFSAIEGFLEIKLPDALKQYRTNYAKTCDSAKLKK